MDAQLNKHLEKAAKNIDPTKDDKALLMAYLNGKTITTEKKGSGKAMTNLFYNLFDHHSDLIEPALNAARLLLSVNGELPKDVEI